MRRKTLRFTAGGILLAAMLCFFFNPLTIAAIFVPVVLHELAHIAALSILGLRIKGFRVELRGFCIEYAGYCGAFGHALAAAAGPAVGFAYAFAASTLSRYLDGQWLALSAGFSLLLSLFNLLPALPLDGGRILENLSCAFLGDRVGIKVTNTAGIAVGALMLGVGLLLLLSGRGGAVAIAATWLLLAQDERHGIVKMREVL